MCHHVLSRFIFYFLCVCVGSHEFMYPTCTQVLVEARGCQILSNSQMPAVGAGNRTQILQSSAVSRSLSSPPARGLLTSKVYKQLQCVQYSAPLPTPLPSQVCSSSSLHPKPCLAPTAGIQTPVLPSLPSSRLWSDP